jgi:hypothetical protein
MNRTLATLLVVIAAASLFAWWAPGAALQPGRLLEAHNHLRNDCLACHVAGAGVPGESCAACHEPAGIGLRNAAGTPLEAPRAAVQGLHQRSRDVACAVCHSEHAGRLLGGPAARFTHDRLPADLAGDCLACHGSQAPADDVHRLSGNACGDCHGLDAWTPATFDHGHLGAGAPACLVCHRPDLPRDDLHRELGAEPDCATCHRVSAWSPADYDHDRFFRFDGHHPARCADCHSPGSGYKTYSCTGCHAHSEARLAAEHREEGIRDWKDCVRCHRSGDEDEVEGRGGAEGGHERGHGEDDD